MDVQANQLTPEEAAADLSNVEAHSQPPPNTPGDLQWSKQLATIIFVGLTLVFLVSLLYQPGAADPNGNYFSICGFKNFTGLPCPGCGLTHSFCELGKGHFQNALAWNWLGMPLFVFFILVWLKAGFILLKRLDWAMAFDRVAERVKPVRLFAIAFAVYGVGRIIYILLRKS